MVAHWDQKGVIQKVKEDYQPKEDVLQASYDRLLAVIKEKIAEIQRQGPKVCGISMRDKKKKKIRLV
jgi:hypothetical protein